jgi:hypothetical protein
LHDQKKEGERVRVREGETRSTAFSGINSATQFREAERGRNKTKDKRQKNKKEKRLHDPQWFSRHKYSLIKYNVAYYPHKAYICG